MNEVQAPFAEAFLDGWALAAALSGEGPVALEGATHGLAAALGSRLASLTDPRTKVTSLRRWAKQARPSVSARRLASVPARARALLATLATEAHPETPSPRRGYKPAPGLAASLARRRSAAAISRADRGLGRRLLATLEEPLAAPLLERDGEEAAAVAQLAALGAVDPPPSHGDVALPWALAAAEGSADPVGALGHLVGEHGDRARAELRELAATRTAPPPGDDRCPE